MSSYSAFSGLPLPAPQTFVPNTTGISGGTVYAAEYVTIGKLVFIWYRVGGTSTATTKTFTLPVPIATTTLVEIPLGGYEDNGVNYADGGNLLVDPGTSTMVASLYPAYPGGLSGTWTASGAWGVSVAGWYLSA